MMQPDLFASGAQEAPAAVTVAENDEAITLAQYAEQAYLDYAVSVVKGRLFQMCLTVKSRYSVEFYMP